MSKWISTKEHEPPCGSDILIYTKEGGVSEGQLTSAGHYIQYRWSAKIKPEKVLCWMPKPEGPEVD